MVLEGEWRARFHRLGGSVVKSLVWKELCASSTPSSFSIFALFVFTVVLSFIPIFTASSSFAAMPVQPKQVLALLLLKFSLIEFPPQPRASREEKLAAHLAAIIEQSESGENSTCGRQDKIYFRAFSAWLIRQMALEISRKETNLDKFVASSTWISTWNFFAFDESPSNANISDL